MTTRIQIIRDAIKAEGGIPPVKCGEHYYADGPSSGAQGGGGCFRPPNKRNETIYKVEKDLDGLTDEARKRVVLALREHPEVKDAYLTRKYKKSEGHLKVVFDGAKWNWKI